MASEDLGFCAGSIIVISVTLRCHLTSQKIATICKMEIIVFVPTYFTGLLLRIKCQSIEKPFVN